MIGIPKHLNNKNDVYNCHKLALGNTVSRLEWKQMLLKIKEKTVYNIPILQKTENYMILPYTEHLVKAYENIEVVILEDENYIKLTPVIENDFITIEGERVELQRLDLTLQEVENMIEEVGA